VGRINKPESKPIAIVDSNVIVYAMVKDYSDNQLHQKCLAFLEKGLKGELDYVLALDPIITVEVFSVLRKTLDCDAAEFRVNTFLRSSRIAFLPTSREACQNAVKWAKKKNVPVNDAMIGANAAEYAAPIYTLDEHFNKLEEYGVKTIKPTKT
jgi:predicted nucleic acid-binding protein